jgi:restriction endonuclease S subunit
MDDLVLLLNQIATITSGYPFRSKIPETAGAGVIVIQMKDVLSNNYIDWLNCVETKLISKRKTDWLKPGDILIAARGSHNYAVLINDNAATKTAVASPHFYIIRIKQKETLPEYVAWFLNQEPCQRHFQREAEGSFAKSIRRSVLENVVIVVPPLDKQRAIIGLATAFKKEQEIMEKMINNQKQFMNTLAYKLFK